MNTVASDPLLSLDDSACTATEPVDILRERNGDELECFGHRRIDVDQIDEVIGRRSKAQPHRRFVDYLGSVRAKHGNSDDSAHGTIQHHFDHTPCVTDGPSSG